MRLHSLSLAACLLAFTALPASAAAILSPGDPIVGGVLTDGTFAVGVVGTTGNTNNWPAAEPPDDLINGVIGGGGEKYLNFAKFNTGVVITPISGPSIIQSITFYVANDAKERDPANYVLYGSNSVVVDPSATSFSLADFTLISSGDLALPDDRNPEPGDSGLSQTVNIGASEAYQTYMLVFPTVKTPDAANSMQLSEVYFEGRTVVPEPGVSLLTLTALGLAARRRR